MWMCVVAFYLWLSSGSWQFVLFLEARPPTRFLPNRWGPKTWFSTSVWVWFLFYFSTTFLLGNWYRSTAVVELFFFAFSFSNKDWTFKTTTLFVLFFFLSNTCVFLPCHKYIIVKKLETLFPLTYMYDHKVAY